MFSTTIFRNRKIIKLYVIMWLVVVLAFLCMLVFRIKLQRKDDASFEKLENATTALDSGDQQRCVVLLNDIIARFPEKNVSHQARLLKAIALMNVGHYDEALALLMEVLNNGEPKGIKSLALLKIISIYDLRKDYANVINFSNKFLGGFPRSFFAKDIYLNLAECYIVSGSSYEAIRVFNELLINFPFSEQADRARKRLNEIDQ